MLLLITVLLICKLSNFQFSFYFLWFNIPQNFNTDKDDRKYVLFALNESPIVKKSAILNIVFIQQTPFHRTRGTETLIENFFSECKLDSNHEFCRENKNFPNRVNLKFHL